MKKNNNFSYRYIDFNNNVIEIKNYFVQIWIKKINIEDRNKLDYISLLIISEINGENTVDHISKKTTGSDLVKYVLYSLYLTDQITFIDIYRETNIYKPTKALKDIKIEGLFNKFKDFYVLNKIQNNLKDNFNKQQNDKNINDKIINKSMDDHMFFSYYVLLSNSKNVKNFVDKVNNFDLDLSIFIAFGIHLGIIRRIHLYFVIIKFTNLDDVVSLMDGKHCEDDICLQKGITLEKLKNIYEENRGETYYLL